ncbi:MAG: hypothetical protein K6F99_08510 [Lachnospiraceae bacterium]|nr:hypothetical protein [Lachnospiraceae bacterium]
MDIMKKKFYSMLVGGILSSVVVFFILMMDAVIAGVLFGEKAVAGVNLVVPSYSMAVSIATLLSIGSPILYSEAIGSFKKEKADRIFQTGLTAAIGCGTIIFLVLLFLGDYYLSSFNTTPEILENAKAYMFWIRIDIIVMPLYTFLTGMIYADGNETLSLLADIIGSIGSVLLSVILGRIMGVSGIGLGSLLASLISISICLLHFVNKRNSLKLGVCFSGKTVIQIAYYGIVDAASSLFLSILFAFLNRYLLTRFGSDMLILSSVLIFIVEMQFLLDGVGTAMTPPMSIYMSLGSNEGVMKIWKEARKSAILLGLFFTVLLEILAPLIPEILGISDRNVVDIAVMGARIFAISIPFESLLYLLTSYNVMTKNFAFGVVITALYDLILAALLALILGNTIGIYGVFIGVGIAPILTWFGMRFYIELKEGKAAWPLRLKKQDHPSFLFDFVMEPKSIIDTQTTIEETLKSISIPSPAIKKFAFLFEELCMETYDKNKPKNVNSECILLIGDDSLHLFEMDDGIKFELVDKVETSRSFREYVLSLAIINWSESSQYLTAISFNRNWLEINFNEEAKKASAENK